MPTVVFLHIADGLGALSAFAMFIWGTVAFTRARSNRAVPAKLAPGMLQPIEDRMSRLEQQSEAIAIQVERIAEGQRFVTKLLSDGKTAGEPAPRQIAHPRG